MNAVSVYVNTAKLVLQSSESTATAVCSNPELPRLLLSLRQLLSCVVCSRLVNDPYVPQNGQCSHNVCRLCVRGQKNLHPVCSFCKDSHDFKLYDENKQMRCLLMCYKSLCEHLRCSQLFVHLPGNKLIQYTTGTPTIIVPQMSLQDLVVEGANYDDIFNSFSNDLPKHSIMPPKNINQMPATPLIPLYHTIKSTGIIQQTAPKASTPPASVSGPTSLPVSVYGTKLKVEPSTQMHFKHQSQQYNTSTPIASHHTHAPLPQPVTTTPHPQLIQLNQLKNAGNITYIGPNTRGIVVPIVSSAGTTTVPLSIASARIQTLNRQLAQARALAVSSASSTSSSSTVTNTTTTSTEHRPPLAAFKVSLASSQPLKPVPALTSTSSLATATATTSQLRNPPPIKTVSNGSAMYSVLYTGIGNKITIKRKTDGDEDATQRKNASTSSSNSALLRPLSKTPSKKRGCRCGNTTATPGKLTCCGQRCPCYVDSKSCIGCKCRGCRNPHRPDGNKVRPVIPELACYEIQMADDHGNLNELPIATSSNILNTLSTDSCNVTATNISSLNLNASTTSFSAASTVTSTSNATLIPFRGLHHLTAQSSSSSSTCSTASTMPPLTSTTMPTQTTSMTQASLGPLSASSTSLSTAPGNIVQLDQIQRESLLIQNAEGKFQVVNVFTTGGGGGGGHSSNQVPTLQRIQTLPQTIVSAHNSFILPSSISTTSISGTTTTTSLPQFILQSQQQQQTQQILQHHHQQQHHPQSITTQRIPNNVTATSLPLQLQQQLKQNIITVHTINSNATANTSPVTAPILTPSSSPAPTTAALSLPTTLANNPRHETSTAVELTDSSDMSRNNYTNMIVSSSSAVNTTSISSNPLTVSLAGTVHNQTLNRKPLHSPNI